jgi:hypothetical protein
LIGSKFLKSSPQNDVLHSTNDACGYFYKDCSFNLVLVKNITAMGNSDLRKYKGVLHIKIDACSLLLKLYLHFVFVKGVKNFFFLKKIQEMKLL